MWMPVHLWIFLRDVLSPFSQVYELTAPIFRDRIYEACKNSPVSSPLSSRDREEVGLLHLPYPNVVDPIATTK